MMMFYYQYAWETSYHKKTKSHRCETAARYCRHWPAEGLTLEAYTSHEDSNTLCHQFHWQSSEPDAVLRDCLELDYDVWYSASHSVVLGFPVRTDGLLTSIPLVSNLRSPFGRRVLLSQHGAAVIIDSASPVFMTKSIDHTRHTVCLESHNEQPYLMHRKQTFELLYTICSSHSFQHTHAFISKYNSSQLYKERELQLNASESKSYRTSIYKTKTDGFRTSSVAQSNDTILSTVNSTTTPGSTQAIDVRNSSFQQSLIWDTRTLNQTQILNACKMLSQHDIFGVIQLPVTWQKDIGDLQFDKSRFPDPENFTSELKRLGFDVSLRVDPFISVDSTSFPECSSHVCIRIESGTAPSLLYYGDHTVAVIDITNTTAASWLRTRLQKLKDKYGLLGFGLDGAVSSSVPSGATLSDTLSGRNASRLVNPDSYVTGLLRVLQPLLFSTDGVAEFIERSAIISDLPLAHSLQSGVSDLIVVALESALANRKYLSVAHDDIPFFMPFLRMPLDKNVIISKVQQILTFRSEFVIPHLERADEESSIPIVRPVWWHPNVQSNQSAMYQVSDQFLLGSSLLIAPRPNTQSTSRRVILPPGLWCDHINEQLITSSSTNFSFIINFSESKILYFSYDTDLQLCTNAMP